MRICTWNINGIRSGLTTGGTQVKGVLDALNAEIVGLQETKILRESLTEEIAVVRGYDGFFSFCRKQKRIAYAGVASYCRSSSATPDAAEEGLTSAFSPEDSSDLVGHYDVDSECEFEPDRLVNLDSEGRAVITRHLIRTKRGEMRKLCVINTYCPRVGEDSAVGTEDCRLQYKLDFYRLLEGRAKQLATAGFYVIVMGDLNCSVERIDHCDPDADPDFDGNPARQWLREFLADGQFVDCFRRLHAHTQEAFTCWNTSIRARETNFGSRIDYIIADANLCQEGLISCDQLTDMTGSDHCPVVAEFQIDLIHSPSIPSLCPKNWPQFKIQQRSLKSFFRQTDKPAATTDNGCGPPVMKKTKLDVNHTTTLRKFFTTTIATSVEEKKTAQLPKVVEEPNSLTRVNRAETKSEWSKLLTGPAKPPVCAGHSEPCVLRTVKKSGPNVNRQFYVCARPTGKKENPAASCEHFQWVSSKK